MYKPFVLFQEDRIPHPDDFEQEHIKVTKKMHHMFETIPESATPKSACSLASDSLRRFKACFQEISIAEIEGERADFAIGHTLRRSMLDHIVERTKNNEIFEFRGCVHKIGSSWDGSKLGALDEVDTLYVLDEKQ